MTWNHESRRLFRKGWKILLVIALAMTFLFSMVLLLMYFFLDGIQLEYMKDHYAIIGSLEQKKISRAFDTDKGESLIQKYQSLPTELITLLEHSKTIHGLQTLQSVSARIENVLNVQDTDFPRTSNLCVFKGTILNKEPSESMAVYYSHKSRAAEQTCTITRVRVDEVLCAKEGWIEPGSTMSVIVTTDQSLSLLPKKQYLFSGMLYQSHSSGVYDNSVEALVFPHFTPDMDVIRETVLSWYSPDTPLAQTFLYRYGVVELSDQEALSQVYAQLPQLKKQVQALDHVVTARSVRDMDQMLRVATDDMFLEDGRWIQPEDTNQRVCVINTVLARRNHLKVGDTLSLRLSDHAYPIFGYDSGFPKMFEELQEDYGESASYTIVGVYRFRNMDPYTARHTNYDFNDIFIPQMDTVHPHSNINEFSTTFKVPVEQFDRFQQEVVPQIEAQGYRVISNESRWAEVESSFHSMQQSRMRNLFYAGLLLLGSVVILNAIVSSLYRTDYVIRRIFAGSTRHIRRAYRVPLSMGLILGSLLCVGLLVLFYPLLIASHLQDLPASLLPSWFTLGLYVGGCFALINGTILLSHWLYQCRLARKTILQLMR